MGFKKAILVLLLLIILTMGAASAADTNTTSDNLAATEDKTLELSENDDFEDKLGIESSNHISDIGNSTGKLTDLENVMSLTKDNHKEDKSYDDILSAQNDLNVLNTNYGTYSGLTTEIGSGGNIELNCDYYTYDSGNTITITTPNSVINGKGAIIDMAGSPNMRAFEVNASGVTIKNLTIKNSNYTGNGGAIYFNSSGTVENCNFTNNTASNWGGAVYFSSTGNVTKCNFFDNKAYDGGAVYFLADGTVSNCNFTDNTASRYGGAVYFLADGTVKNCNLTNNSANYGGGAIYFSSSGATHEVKNCNFIGNKATYNGGAVYFNSFGTVTNCNFTGNTADNGGAITMTSGTVTNCTFTNNTASNWGGAVFSNGYLNITNCDFANNKAKYGGVIYSRFSDNVKFRNCNFTNNLATINGGAINFEYSGTLINCNFINNTAPNGEGGAVIFYWNSADKGNVINCNFTNNTALYGSAILFDRIGDVTNCNFTNNQATGDGSLGGAVYFYSTGTVTNCNFTNNKATGNGGALYFSKNGNVTNCNFTDNSASQRGGAVYINSSVNVINCNFANNQATVDYLSSGGAISLSSGTVINCNFTHNTATHYGSAIEFNDTGTVINCNFNYNKGSMYFSYGGAIYFRNNGTVTNSNFTGNTADRGGAIEFYGNGTVTNCTFTGHTSYSYGGAIYFALGSTGNVTNSNFTGNTADYEGGAIKFYGTGTVTNCNFNYNEIYDDHSNGGAIYFNNNGTVTNCNFNYNKLYSDHSNGGAIYFAFGSTGNVTNCNFTNNKATEYGGAIYFNNNGTVTNCNFTNNKAKAGNAVAFSSTGIISDCDFTNNPISKGAIYSLTGDINLYNNIINNTDVIEGKNFTTIQKLIDNANNGDTITIEGSYAGFGIPIRINKSNLTLIGHNYATLDAKELSNILYITANNVTIKNILFKNGYGMIGSAVYIYDNGTVTNCNFTNNKATEYGGAIYFNNNGTVTKCNFTNNSAILAGAIYINNGTVTNCNFINCSGEFAKVIYAESGTIISNCNFVTQGSESLYELVIGGIISNYTINGKSYSLDLEISIITNATEIKRGDTIDFTINLINKGTLNATNITVNLTLPDSLRYKSSNTPTEYEDSRTAIWILDHLNANNSASITFYCDVTGIGEAKLNATTNIENEIDTDNTNNAATLQINVDESQVVTPDKFDCFFDGNGTLLNVSTDTLTFEGEFSNITKAITINKAITFIGNNATFKGVSFIVKSDNVTLTNFNIISENATGCAINASSHSNILLSNNTIIYKAMFDSDAYVLYANNISSLVFYKNRVTYTGNTNGTGKNFAIYLTNATNAIMTGNIFNISLVSVYVPWFEVPSGSGNWVSSPISEGIVVEKSNGTTFDNNEVNVKFIDVVGNYDTIYSVDH